MVQQIAGQTVGVGQTIGNSSGIYNPKDTWATRPQEGQVWATGGTDWGGGLGQVVPAGYVYSNGQWVSPLAAQANTLASTKTAYDLQNAGIKNQADQATLNAQLGYNQVADTAGNKLNALLQNPSSVADTPGYQFQFNQGLEALNRTAAAKGMLGSGNRLYDLTKYGQDRAAASYNDTVNQLGSFLNKTPLQTTGKYQTNGNGTVTLGGTY